MRRSSRKENKNKSKRMAALYADSWKLPFESELAFLANLLVDWVSHLLADDCYSMTGLWKRFFTDD